MGDEGQQEREGREDLFEDLDKFFAPIQDVDWPETVEPEAEAAPAGPVPEEGEPRPSEPLFEDHEPPPSATAPIEPEPEAAPAEGAGPEAGELEEAPPGAAEEPGAPTEEEGVEAFLFGEEEEAEEDVGAQIRVERARPPAAYADLPSPEEPEEAPSEEALEAAAEHFAASVREEVVLEPGQTEPETPLEELLGAEEPEEAPEPPPVRTVRVSAEGLGGPSWQEPTTVEVGPDLTRRERGRNVQLAFATGILLAAAALGSLAIGAAPFAVLAGVLVLIAQGELYFALQKRHYQPATALGLVAGALVLAAGYLRGEAAMLSVAGLGIVAAFLWAMTVPEAHRRNVTSNVGLTVLGIVWIPLFAGYLFVLLRHPDGPALVLATLGLTVAYDASAFAVGYFWGNRPLAPTISPRKSWEGAIGATLVVLAVAVGVVAPSVDLLETIPRAVGLALVVAIFAPIGDLAESIVKRDLQIKDMGSVLPGHGGVLDRIDAMLFVAPAAYLYLRLILS